MLIPAQKYVVLELTWAPRNVMTATLEMETAALELVK